MKPAEVEVVAKLLHGAWAESQCWRSAFDTALEPFEQLPSREQEAWRGVARAAERTLLSQPTLRPTR